ncbi:MAG TPA: TIGR02996 domain-containing protein [Gemmataceae bacterium]|nr:TIGR02996 domain-containing protein [Gemmataceae bacterium]
MTHADAFLQDILAHPDDDTPRLIFADWLEEQGDAASAARAEFIRVQCALAGGELPPQRRAELGRREKQILDEWDKEWVRPIRRLVKNWEFHRGFIEDVGMLTDRFLTHASRLFCRLPIKHLRLWPRVYSQSFPLVERINMAAVADNEYLCCLRSLDLSENQLESRDVRALVVSEHLTRLTALDLSHNRIGDGGIRALAGAPLLGQLECLDLCGNDVGAGGVRVLAHALEKLERSPEGLRLQRLHLFAHNLSAAGQRVIADSPLLRELVRG